MCAVAAAVYRFSFEHKGMCTLLQKIVKNDTGSNDSE
jgi:hypothetical protein